MLLFHFREGQRHSPPSDTANKGGHRTQDPKTDTWPLKKKRAKMEAREGESGDQAEKEGED